MYFKNDNFRDGLIFVNSMTFGHKRNTETIASDIKKHTVDSKWGTNEVRNIIDLLVITHTTFKE